MKKSEEPLSKEEVHLVQNQIGMISALCAHPEMMPLFERYIEQSRPQWMGTLDPVLLQRMSIQELNKSKRNLRHLCEMALRIVQISSIREKFIKQQEKDNEQKEKQNSGSGPQ